jgi:hypothetical protein
MSTHASQTCIHLSFYKNIKPLFPGYSLTLLNGFEKCRLVSSSSQRSCPQSTIVYRRFTRNFVLYFLLLYHFSLNTDFRTSLKVFFVLQLGLNSSRNIMSRRAHFPYSSCQLGTITLTQKINLNFTLRKQRRYRSGDTALQTSKMELEIM